MEHKFYYNPLAELFGINSVFRNINIGTRYIKDFLIRLMQDLIKKQYNKGRLNIYI